jgi:hypothetical protein
MGVKRDRALPEHGVTEDVVRRIRETATGRDYIVEGRTGAFQIYDLYAEFMRRLNEGTLGER